MEKWFRQEWAKTGKKLDMGKSCISFKKLDDLPVELIGQTVARMPAREYIEFYESVIKTSRLRSKPAKKAKAAKKSADKPPSRKPTKAKKAPRSVAKASRK
jgi:hypothetical protein